MKSTFTPASRTKASFGPISQSFVDAGFLFNEKSHQPRNPVRAIQPWGASCKDMGNRREKN
jgi:hypothetical protein